MCSISPDERASVAEEATIESGSANSGALERGDETLRSHPYRYIGCFFDSTELGALVADVRTAALECPTRFPHVTYAYRPEQVDELLFGIPVEVTAIGYGNDGRTEGLRIELSCTDSTVTQMARKIATPHITLSTAAGVEPVETRNLDFQPLEQPFTFVGLFGGYRKDEDRVVLQPPTSD